MEKQSRGSKASDVIKDSIGFLFQVSTVTQWNSVYDAVERLNAIFDDQDNSKALNRACIILTLPLFTSNGIGFLKEYHRECALICTVLDRLQREEYPYTRILWPTLSITVKKLHEFSTNHASVYLPLVMVLTESVQERFNKVLSNTNYQVAMALYPHFRCS